MVVGRRNVLQMLKLQSMMMKKKVEIEFARNTIDLLGQLVTVCFSQKPSNMYSLNLTSPSTELLLTRSTN